MPTCRTEMIFISNLRATFCAKHDFTVAKRMHAIKLLCKNAVETFNSKDFFSILVTQYFSILKQFCRFWNIFLDSKIFFRYRNISLYFNFFFRFCNFFLDFIIFFDSEIFLWILKLFSWFSKFSLDYESFFSILKVFSRWRLSATIAEEHLLTKPIQVVGNT